MPLSVFWRGCEIRCQILKNERLSQKQKKEDMSIKKLSSDLLQGFNLDEALV